MGKPAARIGDMTAHGGSIVMGFPTVLIGGMPAARLGDMHVCPMVTPGVPPVPHVGGPITLGSAGVLIGGMPAARMGDMAVCVGPPSTIILGCMTVLIGETGGDGGGGGGGGGIGMGGGSASAANAALISAAIAGQSTQTDESNTHFLHAQFLDKAKLPVGGMQYQLSYGQGNAMGGMLAGPIKKSGIDEGNYDITLRGITNVKWSSTQVNVGDSVDMIAETVGVESGEKAVFIVYVRDGNYTDHELETIETDVSGDQAKVSWKFEIGEKYYKICEKKGEKKRYSQPFFFFKVTINELHEQSGMMYAQDWVEMRLQGEDGSSMVNKKYKTILASGEIKEGTLDSDGKVKIGKISPGNVDITVDLNS